MTIPHPMLQKYLISDLPKADDLLPWLRRLDENRWYSNFGQLATEFERKIENLTSAADPFPQLGSIHVTTMVTGYHALEVALRLLNVRQGGKVLIPAVTFPACPLAAQFTGAEAILGDVDPMTWTLTPEIARRVATTTNLGAVMPVAIYGVPLPIEGWDQFSRDTGIPVIIDAAAAIETQPIPQHGLVAHSLHATKPFGVGEGGLLVGRNQKFITDARIYSNFGTYDRIAAVEGSNTKMSEYHAAVGLQQAERWPAIKKKRREILALYLKHLKPLMSSLSLQPGLETAVVSTLMLRLKRPIAANLITRGLQSNIAFHKMYLPPLYRHPYFTGLALANDNGKILSGDASPEQKAAYMPNSEMMFAHMVGIPFHPFLSENDIAHAAATLARLMAV